MQRRGDLARMGVYYVFTMYCLCIYYVFTMYLLCIYYVFTMYLLCIQLGIDAEAWGPGHSALGLGLTVPLQCVGVGVNSALQCYMGPGIVLLSTVWVT